MAFYWPFMRLMVHGDTLYGKKPFRPPVELKPEDIKKVEEYTGNNPFLGVVTSKGSFTAGIFRRDYESVVSYLETNTPFRPKQSFGHKANVAYYGRLLDLLAWWRFRGR